MGDFGMIEHFAPPPGMNCRDALYAIFSHYCSPFKSSMTTETEMKSLDSASFMRMCKDTPQLSSHRIDRHDYDIVSHLLRIRHEYTSIYDDYDMLSHLLWIGHDYTSKMITV